MITLLHTYYPPEEILKTLDLDHTIWTHSGPWKEQWDEEYKCPSRYFIPNRGKDVGGKLFAFEVLLKQNCKEEFVLLLHDKKSPQVIDGARWKNNLWKIKDRISQAIDRFHQEPSVGIIANHSAIIHPADSGDQFAYATNKELIFSEAKTYGLEVENKTFVAGTIFLARLQPFLDFFETHAPLEIRAKFEEGNVLDLERASYTHSWERLLSWIVTSKGYSIEGIE